VKISKRKQVGSDVSIEWLKSAESRPYSTCVAMETVKKPANRENNDLLLFFEPQQIIIFHYLFIVKDTLKWILRYFQ
jgi:hypothetical protein